MQSGEIVELAAVVSRHGPTLLVGAGNTQVLGIEAYWAAAKCRFDRWGRLLGRLRRGEEPVFDERPGTVRGLFEEILGSEVLTRIWTATVASFDRRRELHDNEIVVRSVYIGHLEMRQRVLQILIGAPGVDSVDAVALNRLRRRAELWTDMLLAPLAATHSVEEFAFEPPRLRQFAAERHQSGDSVERTALADASLRTAVGHAFTAAAPNADLNAQVAGTILGAFAADRFDSCGVLRSLWMMRLAATADDTQRLIDDLFHVEQSSAPPPGARRFG